MRVTFRVTGFTLRRAMRFGVTRAVAIGLAIGITYLVVDALGQAYITGALAATVLMPLFSYPVFRYWVFRE